MAADENPSEGESVHTTEVRAGSFPELLDKLAKTLGGKATNSILSQLLDRGEIDKGEIFEEASARMGRMMDKDRHDALIPTSHAWLPLNEEQTAFGNVGSGQDGDDDIHIHVVQRVNTFEWHFWVLCPFRQMSVPVVLHGDRARAMHRANLMIDIGNGKLDPDVLRKPEVAGVAKA